MRFGNILELTGTLVAMYLVLSNAPNFSVAIRAGGAAYSEVVQTLQGR